jgi:hypothetical protein
MPYPPVLVGPKGLRRKQQDMWYRQTESGVFWIRFDPSTRTRFLLGIGDEPLGWYYSPEAAADDVFLQKTGWSEWDSLAAATKPKDLSEWVRMDCQAWSTKFL